MGFRRSARVATAATTITTMTIPAIRVELVPPVDDEVALVNIVEVLEETGVLEKLEVELELMLLELITELDELVLELDVEELEVDELVLVLAPTGCKLARRVWFTQSPS